MNVNLNLLSKLVRGGSVRLIAVSGRGSVHEIWFLDTMLAVVIYAAIWAGVELASQRGAITWHRPRRSQFHWQIAAAFSALLMLPACAALLVRRDLTVLNHLWLVLGGQLLLCGLCLCAVLTPLDFLHLSPLSHCSTSALLTLYHRFLELKKDQHTASLQLAQGTIVL